ncbi:hypothetical protein [Mesorhizobium sp. BH1-1-4]|uniref:hypothetical protein n=1 Tax=Mesorhizobium sp. BH1-1-4 TaxID=2876662 RepID=UPI001CD16FF2|nr:hypothetical protein [Mesorhizobium sp. BH1-1-4]MBZ9995861.1 hypothetical protein [Mesorhizobium sp. BH1-1-4]
MQTLEGAFQLLFPDAPRSLSSFSEPPALPADIFAFAGYILDGSSAYHHVAPDNGPPIGSHQLTVDDTLRDRAIKVGKQWRENATEPGKLPSVPQHVTELWRQLADHAHQDVHSGPLIGKELPRWWIVLLELFMIADEASQDVGFVLNNVFYAPVLEAFTQEDVVSGREFRRVQSGTITLSTADTSVLCVQPKSRTPSVGCTMRSMSHHLALLPRSGEVSARWQTPVFGEPAADAGALGLLLIPFPYRIQPEAFVAGGNVKSRWGWFDVEQRWLPAESDKSGRKAFVDFVLELTRAARRAGKRVDGVVLPELSLDYALFAQLAKAMSEEGKVDFLIAGISDRESRKGNFVAIAPFFQFEGATDDSGLSFRIREKHHRWKLTKDQIEAYGIGDALSTDRNWWEHLDLLERDLDLFVYRGGTSLTTLICEDLARVDPCQVVLRSIGPNLVIALLMDGPQLEGRWPGRYATVLAEDPGSSVLTFTSLGLIERQNAQQLEKPNTQQRFPLSSSVGLWKDEANGVQRLELPRSADAICLQLKAASKTEHTLDGRSDGEYAHRWVFENYFGITAVPNKRPKWIPTGEAR